MSDRYLPPLIRGNMSKVEFLAANGYLDEPPTAKIKESDPLVKQATVEYQQFAGLVADGDFGPVSFSRANDKRCALPDLNRGFIKQDSKWVEFSVESACTRKWSDSVKRNLTCCHNLSFGSISNADLDAAWWRCFTELSKVCDIGFKRVPFSKSANLFHEKESIDGASGTLAYHYLCSCNAGASESLRGAFDSGERWLSNFFQGVCTHEVIHGLGFSHSSDPKDLEYPYYNGNIITPQAGDIKRLQAVYGKPISQPGDPGVPVPPGLTLEQRVFQNEVSIKALWAAINHYHG